MSWVRTIVLFGIILCVIILASKPGSDAGNTPVQPRVPSDDAGGDSWPHMVQERDQAEYSQGHVPSSPEPVETRVAAADATPTPTPTRPSIANARKATSGWASYYWGSRNFHGTAHVASPSGRWTGRINRWITVCVKAHGCQRLPLVDFCACGPRHGLPTVVDLSIEAVRLFGLSTRTGIWHATVSR